MMDRSTLTDTILIADRYYECYNLFAHAQEKGWKYLIRVKDPTSSKCITGTIAGCGKDAFDINVKFNLTKSASKKAKEIPDYKFIPATVNFDYLPAKHEKGQPYPYYGLSFRAVRFKITEDSYETVITNMPADLFPPSELKKLYQMRWGIETSFRELKYTIGLLHFHSKKADSLYQEIFAALTMYNYAESIARHVVIHQPEKTYLYQINFSQAAFICRHFFRSDMPPPDVEALISRYVVPIRPDRSTPRVMKDKKSVSFFYRAA